MITLRKNINADMRFSLIEMLVVIAIIGILSSMLLPSLLSAQQSALSISCLSKMRHISLGFNMYSSENNNRIPISYDPSNALNWHSYIYPIICEDVKSTDGQWEMASNSQLFCPSDDGKYGTKLTTYAMNAYAGTLNWWGFSRNIKLNITKIRNPGTVYLVGEKESGATSGGYYITKTAFINLFSWLDDESTKQSRMALRHNMGENFIFFDGHMKYENAANVYDFTDEMKGKNITSYYPGMN